MKTFGVGLVGVEPKRSWAARAHVPALAALHERFRLVGIANSSAASSRAAVDALGVGAPFASVDDLVASPDVDVVVVTVKVPAHRDLVTKALDAGKHVYCEWPLGRTLDEAQRLERAARDRGVLAVVGTQALRAPAVLAARRLVADGYVGEVRSVSIVGNGGLGGADVARADAYTLDDANGATLLTIPFGHLLAALRDIFGDVASVAAHLDTRRTEATVVETGDTARMTAPGEVYVIGEFATGVPFSAHYRGGTNAGTGFIMEIVGDGGLLRLTAPLGHIQLAPVALRGARGTADLADLALPEHDPAVGALPVQAANVAAVYADLYADLTEGTHRAPTFADAVAVHQVLATVEAASASGTRVRVER